MLADMSLPDDSSLDEIKTADAASPRQSASERDALCHPKRESRTGAGYYKPFGRTAQDMLSRMTVFSPRAVAEWSRGKEPSAPAKRVFAELDRLLDALARLMKPKEVGQWLKQPNLAFEGRLPCK